jgi:ketosteroid isomerase-like protein
VERFRELQDAFNRRDRAGFLALCDADFENVPSREWPESAPTRGREAVWDFLVQVQEAWDGAVFELGEVVDAPPHRVVANQRARMHGAASGADVDWSFWLVMSFRDGKVVRSNWFADRAEALQAAGLSG